MTITIRDAAEEDIPAIFEVRTSVRENHLSVEQMAEMGITNETIRQALRKEPCIWVAVQGDHIVGFSMGDAADACLFAAFVRPERAGQPNNNLTGRQQVQEICPGALCGLTLPYRIEG